MNMKEEQNTPPIKPYDDSMWEKWSIYDSAPYVMDVDIRSNDKLALVSGNIIKSYRCLVKEPYELKHE